jgi:16S rRNA (guanine527-N7)-methyltransferase
VTGGLPVSRETAVRPTAPPPPPEAERAFGPSLPRAVEFADILCGAGVERGLLGPAEPSRIWSRHLLNCVVVQELIPQGSVVDDVGSGAGLPGIVLALARPDLTVTLVEPLLRRAGFLREVVETMKLGNVSVLRQRAEERARSAPGVDVVTARAVARLDRLATWCVPLLRPGGVLLAMKGENAAAELAAAKNAISAVGGRSPELILCGGGLVDPPTSVVRIASAGRAATSRRRKPAPS